MTITREILENELCPDQIGTLKHIKKIFCYLLEYPRITDRMRDYEIVRSIPLLFSLCLLSERA